MSRPGTPRAQALHIELGERLRRLRKERGMSGDLLAERATATGFKNFSAPEVSKLESGKQTWTQAHAWGLAEALGIDPGELLGVRVISMPPSGDLVGELDPFEQALIRHGRAGNAEGALMALAPLLAKNAR